MTHQQFAAWLASLFEDYEEGVFSGWMEEYRPDKSTIVDGEVYFDRLALKLIKKFDLEVTP